LATAPMSRMEEEFASGSTLEAPPRSILAFAGAT